MFRGGGKNLLLDTYILEAVDIALDAQHGGDGETSPGAKQLEDSRGRVWRLPFVGDQVGIAVRHDAAVRRRDHSRRWIKSVRQVFKRNIPRPVVVIGVSGGGYSPLAVLSDREPARRVGADVAVHVRINEILHGSREVAQRRGKFLPVLGAVDFEERKAECVGLERRPAEGEVAVAVVRDNRPVARDLHDERVVALASDLDDFLALLGANPLSVVEVLPRIAEIEGLDVKVLDVRTGVGRPHAILSLWPRTTNGSPG